VTGEAQLVPQASQAYAAMIAAAKADGASIIWRVGYRSYDTQQALSATPPTFYGKDADSYVAKPGRSEHQAGLAVDVASEQGYGTRFPETKEFAWLRANSYKYGFILRYPHDKTDITGYNYESWHYRYVGVEAAAAFGPNSELTLEEYLGGR
jgi:D-alanyl-D-alanine carboxypeptidase